MEPGKTYQRQILNLNGKIYERRIEIPHPEARIGAHIAKYYVNDKEVDYIEFTKDGTGIERIIYGPENKIPL